MNLLNKGLLKLEELKLLNCLLLAYNIWYGLAPISLIKDFQKASVTSTRGSNMKFKEELSKRAWLTKLPFYSLRKYWNKIEDRIKYLDRPQFQSFIKNHVTDLVDLFD